MKSWLIKVRPDKTLKENSGKDYQSVKKQIILYDSSNFYALVEPVTALKEIFHLATRQLMF